MYSTCLCYYYNIHYIAGWLYDVTQLYKSSFYFGGINLILSAVVVLPLTFSNRMCSNSSVSKDSSPHIVTAQHIHQIFKNNISCVCFTWTYIMVGVKLFNAPGHDFIHLIFYKMSLNVFVRQWPRDSVAHLKAWSHRHLG